MLKIPNLIPKVESRECYRYAESIRDEIVYTYLFEGTSMREMDIIYCGLSTEKSKGFTSMNILHAYGIGAEFKKCFSAISLEVAISTLEGLNDDGYQMIIDSLKRYKDVQDKRQRVSNISRYGGVEESRVHYHTNSNDSLIIPTEHIDIEGNSNLDRLKNNPLQTEKRSREIMDKVCSVGAVDIEHYQQELDNNIQKMHHLKDDVLETFIEPGAKPECTIVVSKAYKRNSAVVVATLRRADGYCEHCNQKAPFIRKSDQTPYLEVHHKIPLSEGGCDDLENTIALCPNCHRMFHFGI